MLGDVVKELHGNIVDRIRSPLLGSFAASWSLWNYKFLLIVLSEEPVARSFDMIATLAYPTAETVWVKGVLGPLVTTLLYIFAYPYPAKFVYEYSRKRQQEILAIKRRIEDETPLTLEESRRVRADARAQSVAFADEREQFMTEIADLKSALNELKAETPEAVEALLDPEQQTQSSVSLTSTQVVMLKKIASGSYDRAHLVGSSSDRVRAEFDIDELRQHSLIETAVVAGSRMRVYRLTHEGRRLLLAGDP